MIYNDGLDAVFDLSILIKQYHYYILTVFAIFMIHSVLLNITQFTRVL